MAISFVSCVSVTLLMFTNVPAVMQRAIPSSLEQCNSTILFSVPENVNGSKGNWSQVCNVTHKYNSSEAPNQSNVHQEGPAPRIIAMTVDVIGVLCNTLLILAILVDPLNVLRKGAWFTILNLSIADLTAALSNFMTIFIAHHDPEKFIIVYQTFDFFWLFGAGGSFLLLALLTVETYLIVKYPIRSRMMLSAAKTRFLCAGVWTIAILLGMSNIQYTFGTSLEPTFIIYIAQIGVLELAVLVQVLLKVLIIREIMKSEDNMIEASAKHRNNKHREIAKTIVILNVMLIVTAFPYFVAKQIEHLYNLKVIGGKQLARLFANYYEPVAVLNFALNPILYSLRMPDYRRSLFALFCRCRNQREFSKNFASMKTALSMRSAASSFREDDEESTKL